jgi:hypothetical protein
MWTLIRFTLAEGGGYGTAFEILRQAGFRAHQAPDSPQECSAMPAAVIADVLQDPAVISRAVFEALAEARLRPVAVAGCEIAPVRRRAAALASR